MDKDKNSPAPSALTLDGRWALNVIAVQDIGRGRRWKVTGCYLARVARAGLSEEVTFELCPGQRWNLSWDQSLGRAVLGRGNRRPKGPERECVVLLELLETCVPKGIGWE